MTYKYGQTGGGTATDTPFAKISQTDNIDGTTLGGTVLYTVPTAKRLVVTGLMMWTTDTDNIDGGGSQFAIKLGNDASLSTFISAPELFGNTLNLTNYVTFYFLNFSVSYPILFQTQTVVFTVDTVAFADVFIVSALLTGMLTDA